VANAGPDQVVDAGTDSYGAVTLDASATVDPDGDELSYWWMIDDGLLAQGVQSTVQLSPDSYPVTLVVRDPADHVSTDEVLVVVTGNPTFIRADSNTDGTVDISDAINTLGFLFTSAGEVTCQDAADANDSGDVDISDAIFTLGFLFFGSPPTLPQPHPNRGPDPTLDAVGCDSYKP